MSIEKIFPNMLEHDIKINYTFRKNWLGSMLKIKNKSFKDLEDYLKEKNIKGGTTALRKYNKGILPKLFKTRQAIANFLEMEQKDLFIDLERLYLTKEYYLKDNTRKN